MRKILLISMLLLSTPAFAQSVDKVLVDKSDLTADQLARIEATQTINKWTGMGKEIGQAMDGALTSITLHADEMGNTKVGRFAMWMIAIKILGRIVIPAIGWLIITPIFIVFLFKYVPRNVVTSVREDKTKIYEYEMHYPQDWQPTVIVTGMAYLATCGITLAIMFA